MVRAAWHQAYTALIARLDDYCAHGHWTFCGLGACVDAVLSLHDAVPVLLASDGAAARRLGQMLSTRALSGIGGEIRVDWDAGPEWIDATLPLRTALGGTGPHAARVLSLLGAPALLALSHRDAEQMACLDSRIRLASGGQATPAAAISPQGLARPKIYIFEFTACRAIGDVVAPRSSRIIVRFSDPALEDDAEFEALSIRLASKAGAGVLSGFSGVGSRLLDATLARARLLGLNWRAAGVPVVHLEMAGFDTPDLRDRTLAGLRGAFTSLGLSQSEYQALVPVDAPETATIVASAERLGIDRLCIHADAWAMTATRGDPEQERAALMVGCLLASARAAVGHPARPVAIDKAARFEMPPEESRQGGWNIVTAAAPYLPRPITTLGMGDTFMAGCLLVLGQPHRPAATTYRDETWPTTANA